MNEKIKKICCIGAGYVGGPSMAIMAEKWKTIQFTVVDIDELRIKNWNEENLDLLPVYEPGLDEIVQRNRGVNLFFSTNVENSISEADIIFIAVNTPIKTEGLGAGEASDLTWIEACARDIGKYAKNHTIVVEKSTIPVKTAQIVNQILNIESLPKNNQTSSNKTFSLLSNPEFLAEGTAINDLLNPDRVIIGGEDKNAIKTLVEIYKKWVPQNKIITTNIWSSELSKLVANAFLAQRISSINSISAICEATGANVQDVSRAIGSDSRIGNKFLQSGPGFGGSCFKKDILNLIYLSKSYGLIDVAQYWEQVLKINNWQQNRIYELVVKKLFGNLKGKKISFLGFSFKSNTNDTRESPAINIAKKLISEGAILKIHDPKVNKSQIDKALNPFKINNQSLQNWQFYEDVYETFNGSSAIIILTEWNEFKDIEWVEVIKKMIKPAWIFDTRSLINGEYVVNIGFKYWGVGNDN